MATDPSTAVERDAPACPLQALLEAIQAVDASRPDLTTAEELEALEHTLGEFTDRLRGLLLKLQVQRALDGEVLRTERDYLIGHRERMAYGKVADAGPPLGGDAMRTLSTRWWSKTWTPRPRATWS